jgi:tetratricopeptide (TPR) repeat protein
MKTIYLLILVLISISCQSNSDKEKSLELYKKGNEVIGTADSAGNPNFSAALDFFTESVKLNPDFIDSRYMKLQCEIDLGKLDDALVTSNTTLDKFGNNEYLIPVFYISSGLLERVKGNMDTSIKCFESALKIYERRIKKKSDDIDAILNKATLLCYLNRESEALDFINSISLDEKKSTFY